MSKRLTVPENRPVTVEHTAQAWPIWRPLPDWEGAYLVAHTGRVWSLHVSRPLSVYLNDTRPGHEYLRVDLRMDGARRQAYLHHLVLEAHASERPGDPQEWHAHHVDGDQTNNALRNLRWAEASEHIDGHSEVPEEERPNREEDEALAPVEEGAPF